MPRDTAAVDYVVTFDHVLAGRQQAWALLSGLGITNRVGAPLADPAIGPFSVELLAGSGDDPAAARRFEGAIEVLSPYLSAGTLVVPSGRVQFEQAAVLRADPDAAAQRVSALLADGIRLDGVLSPRDPMSRAVLDVLPVPVPVPEAEGTAGETAGETAAEEGEDATQARPTIVTGGGAQLASLRAILEGSQRSTVLEDPRSLGIATARLVRQIARGATVIVTSGTLIDNGSVGVPAVLVEPVSVDAQNLERTIIDSGYWTREQLEDD